MRFLKNKVLYCTHWHLICMGLRQNPGARGYQGGNRHVFPASQLQHLTIFIKIKCFPCITTVALNNFH